MNKILITLTILFCTCIANISAQNNNGCMSKKEFEERQKEFLIKKAGLTNEEAEKFFPIYFELQNKKFQYNKEAWDKIKRGKKESNLTDSEYNKIVEDVINSRIAIGQLELEYAQKYMEILPAKKVFEIQRAEMRFHRELLKNTKEKKN